MQRSVSEVGETLPWTLPLWGASWVKGIATRECRQLLPPHSIPSSKLTQVGRKKKKKTTEESLIHNLDNYGIPLAHELQGV